MNRDLHTAKSDTVLAHLPVRRKRAGLALAEGERVAAMALDGAWEALLLFMREDFAGTSVAQQFHEAAGARKIRVIHCNAGAMEKLSDCETPPPVGVLVRPPGVTALPDSSRILVLDGVRDPGNAGTLVRSAAAFGFAAVLADTSINLYNEKMIRASAGTCFLPGAVAAGGSPADLSRELAGRGFRIVTLEPRADHDLRDVALDPKRPLALVLGGEVAGIDPAAWVGATGARIPMRRDVESLNVGVAGAIALYELSSRIPR